MPHLRWMEAQNHYESLAVCLRALLARAGDERPYDELVAALGLGAAITATEGESLGWWCTLARDSTLVETAQRYGLELRPLHPPDAAQGLSGSAEFARHFGDSYVPLITQALEHHQPVLAWRGWPPPRDRLWGVLTHAEGRMLLGRTLWHGGQPMPLTGPAHQAYVVQGVRSPAVSPGPIGLLQHVARQTCAVWDGTWSSGETVRTGRAAYDAWSAVLQAPGDRSTGDLPLYREHSQIARVLVAARAYLAVWLRRIVSSLDSDQTRLVARWASACDYVGEKLLPFESAEVVREVLSNAGGVERICKALDAAARIEEEAMESVRVLAGEAPRENASPKDESR